MYKVLSVFQPIMKNFLTTFFVALGVLFSIIIITGAIFFIVDPYHIRPIIFGMMHPQKEPSTGNEDRNPLLSPTQEKTLEKIGVDPATLPSQITPEMEACFNQKLGEQRTTEIKNGSSPTPTDYTAAHSCIQ